MEDIPKIARKGLKLLLSAIIGMICLSVFVFMICEFISWFGQGELMIETIAIWLGGSLTLLYAGIMTYAIFVVFGSAVEE